MASFVSQSRTDLAMEIPSHLLCPICNHLLKIPLKTSSCGHSFCHQCLEDLLNKQEQNTDSIISKRDPLSIGHGYIFICPYPKCGRQQRLGSKKVDEFQVNGSLQEMIEYYKIK